MYENFHKPLSWNPELVSRFWDYWSSKDNQVYFGEMFGHVTRCKFGIMAPSPVSRYLRTLKDLVRGRRMQRPHLLCVAQKD